MIDTNNSNQDYFLIENLRRRRRRRRKQRNTEPLYCESWTRTNRFLKSVLQCTCSPVANIVSKSSVPEYRLFCFVLFCFFFACFFFPFMAIFSHLLILCLYARTETGTKDENSKNKWKNINCYKRNKFFCMLTRCFNNKTLPPVQVGYVNSQKVTAPLSSS